MVIDGRRQRRIAYFWPFVAFIQLMVMVIDGRNVPGSDHKVVKLEGERVFLPSRFVKQIGFAGTDPIDCWLLVVTPGRYRLLRQPTTPAEGALSRILDQWDRVGVPGDVLDATDSNAQAGIRARLIPCIVSPPEPGWRINLPKEAKELVPEREERRFVFVMIVAGYIELWFPDTFRRAVSGPISQILP